MRTCPNCRHGERVVKKGFYQRPSDGKRIQRYLCRCCSKQFSDQIRSIDYRHRKRSINHMAFLMLCKGVSQRGAAFMLNVKPETIARRVVRFGLVAEAHLAAYRASRPQATAVMFDEMESFEHTKCKPLTIPIAVEAKTRKILALKVGQIAAKGPLAAISRKKYGPRPCERSACLDRVLTDIQSCVAPDAMITTDRSHHYPAKVKHFFPEAQHATVRGRRGCVVGQGELKRGGFDPLFSLNHTYAMIRDNIKRLTRRTWCTTKRRDRLELLIYLYAYFHNERLEKGRRVTLRRAPIPI